ncbi:MAG: sigma 54-interacting transcriptional regulator [Kofleriaceae bacterium]
MEVQLDDVPAWLWQRFHDHAARVEAPRAFTPVVERWRRSQALGVAVDGPAPDERLLRGEALRLHTERAGALAATAARTLDQAQAFLAERGYLMLLADPDGVVVSTRGGGAFADEARRVRLIAGACWSEAARGTNAIGTALCEARPTAVLGHAHYGRRFHGLVCYASPVCGPDGRVVGVLDATSTLERADDVVGFTVTSAARALEDALRQGAYASAGSAVARALTQAFERVGGPVLLIEPPGRIARANGAAQAVLGVPERAGRVQAVLGVGWSVLRAEAASPTAGGLALTLRDGDGRPQPMRAMVDPIAALDGSVIALVVYLESPRARPARAAPPAIGVADPFAALFSRDPGLDHALGFARRVAASDVPVMILAETGAGKELVATAIHQASLRRGRPFVAVNCGALAPSLLESELFGYAPGAFSGAERTGRAGYFAEASGGTLFLDEVAEMSPAMQAALLRVLEGGSYRRVGDAAVLHADVRIVTATCRDLPALVADGRFRQDLYYRLKGATVTLPPVRARADRLALARHLIELLAARRGAPAPTVDAALAAWIEAQPWPGNVRELKTVLDVALVLADGAPALGLAHLPPEPVATPAAAPTAPHQLEEAEASVLRQALAACAGNVSAVAARLGVARSTVYRMMRRAGVRG